ncbi:MAG TPA: GNAT family N-acetyltransferase [Polyangia bacterium]
MQVRPARPEDAATIQRLYQELVPGDGNINVRPERIASLLEDATNHLFVIDTAGVVCGTAFLTICLDVMYAFQPYAVVENVIVGATVRGRGAGRLLMAALEQTARAAQCTKLMLLSSLQRTDAHRFFEDLGFEGSKKRGFVKYLNRTPPLRAASARP